MPRLHIAGMAPATTMGSRSGRPDPGRAVELPKGGQDLDNAESYGEETAGSREGARGAGEEARRRRSQAEAAWDRVRSVLEGRQSRGPSGGSLLRSVDQAPVKAYLAGICGSLVASAWLRATGRQTAGLYVGGLSSIIFVIGLLLKIARQRRRPD